ncbi:hypothetical protein [Streptomyces cadmiisoli]|nr:hypothetical protein [Streptomyces cadmiisoli]
MRREHTSGSGGSGLSTEDLATPRGSIEDEGRTGSPAFPGEATEPAGESTAPPARDEAMPMAEEEV